MRNVDNPKSSLEPPKSKTPKGPTAESASLHLSATKKKMTKDPPSLMRPKTDMVTILVGPEETKFVVHQEFLTYHSPYFRRCLEGSFEEAITKVVKLHHTTAEVFGLLVNWIYTQKIGDIPQEQSEREPDEASSTMATSVDPYLDLWILADYVQIPQLQNKAIDKLQRLSNTGEWMSTEDTHKRLYDKTSEGSILRKYWAALHARLPRSDSKWFELERSVFPPDMIFDMFMVLRHMKVVVGLTNTELMNFYVKTGDK